ncbi:alpha/beta hydrolase, partial [Burkholderia ubonensis]|uniref:alpha/beta hydrolase n=1 Tax=Burkholderia ubonensis TaxID=101571 RepID=UPI000B2DF218
MIRAIAVLSFATLLAVGCKQQDQPATSAAGNSAKVTAFPRSQPSESNQAENSVAVGEPARQPGPTIGPSPTRRYQPKSMPSKPSMVFGKPLVKNKIAPVPAPRHPALPDGTGQVTAPPRRASLPGDVRIGATPHGSVNVVDPYANAAQETDGEWSGPADGTGIAGKDDRAYVGHPITIPLAVGPVVAADAAEAASAAQKKAVPATASTANALPKRAGTNGQYDVVRVFFGTDRGVTVDSLGKPQFSSDHAQAMAFGSVDVSIPRNHVTGHIESPSVMRMEFHRDPSRDVTILQVTLTPYDQFRSEMRTKALNASTPSVLLFVHGYRVSFDDAAMRTAQMAYDLDFAGAPVFFSWPSRGTLLGYFDDEQAIERAQGGLKSQVQRLANPAAANSMASASS